jgi:hypothetical protein
MKGRQSSSKRFTHDGISLALLETEDGLRTGGVVLIFNRLTFDCLLVLATSNGMIIHNPLLDGISAKANL